VLRAPHAWKQLGSCFSTDAISLSFKHFSCTVLVANTFQPQLPRGDDALHIPSPRVEYQNPPVFLGTLVAQHPHSGPVALQLSNGLSAPQKWKKSVQSQVEFCNAERRSIKQASQSLPLPSKSPHFERRDLAQVGRTGCATNFSVTFCLPTFVLSHPAGDSQLQMYVPLLHGFLEKGSTPLLHKLQAE
jgi:hypothetical protein